MNDGNNEVIQYTVHQIVKTKNQIKNRGLKKQKTKPKHYFENHTCMPIDALHIHESPWPKDSSCGKWKQKQLFGYDTSLTEI